MFLKSMLFALVIFRCAKIHHLQLLQLSCKELPSLFSLFSFFHPWSARVFWVLDVRPLVSPTDRPQPLLLLMVVSVLVVVAWRLTHQM